MRLPRVRADFNTSSLDNFWTREDLKTQEIELSEGMRCVFYDLDAENGQQGFLHGKAVVQRDATSGVFRMRSDEELRFTPGYDLGVLDVLYPDEPES